MGKSQILGYPNFPKRAFPLVSLKGSGSLLPLTNEQKRQMCKNQILSVGQQNCCTRSF